MYYASIFWATLNHPVLVNAHHNLEKKTPTKSLNPSTSAFEDSMPYEKTSCNVSEEAQNFGFCEAAVKNERKVLCKFCFFFEFDMRKKDLESNNPLNFFYLPFWEGITYPIPRHF